MPTVYDPFLKQSRLGETTNVRFVSTATATVANTATETSIIGTGQGSLDLPTNFFYPGRSISFSVSGVLGTLATPGTLQIRADLEGTTVLDTGAQTPTGSLSNRLFVVSGIITCRTDGSSGTVFGQGNFGIHISATDSNFWDMENTSTVTINTTDELTFDVTAQWGTADASNTISGTNVYLYSLEAV